MTERSDVPVIAHWVGGKAWEGAGERTAPVYDPATGAVAATCPPGVRGDVDAAVAVGRGGRGRVARHLARPAHPGPVRLPRAGRDATATSWPRSSPPSTARSLADALGEVARGLEVVEFACGIPHLLKGEHSEQVSTDVDVHSRAPAPRRGRPASRRSTSRPWSRCGCSPSPSPAATRSCSSPPSGIPSASMLLAELLARGRAPGRRVQRGPRRRRRRSTRCSTHPDVARRQLRGLDAGRPPRVRDRQPRPASGCRRSAAPRTTWSCCPTPTSTSPPTPRSAPATARPASGAWRSPSSSPSATIADDLVGRDRRRASTRS